MHSSPRQLHRQYPALPGVVFSSRPYQLLDPLLLLQQYGHNDRLKRPGARDHDAGHFFPCLQDLPDGGPSPKSLCL
jgi:hypothetical protein